MANPNAFHACTVCGLVQRTPDLSPGAAVRCARCGEILVWHKPKTQSKVGAFALAALLLFVPAVLFPLGSVSYLGNYNEVSLWQAINRLYVMHHFFIGSFVALTAVVAPICECIGWSVLALKVDGRRWIAVRRVAQQLVAAMAHWDMAPLYLVALVVGIVKFGEACTVHVGSGALAFALMVAAVKGAAASYDTSSAWKGAAS